MRGYPNHPVTCIKCGSKWGYPLKQLCRACQDRPGVRWTQAQIELLREAYSQDRAYLIQQRTKLMQLTGFHLHQLQHKARRMGIKLFVGRRRYWTEVEERYLANHAGEMKVGKLAKILGRNEDAVRVHMGRIGLRTKWVRQGMSAQDFADVMGVGNQAVYGWIRAGKLRIFDGRISEHDARQFIQTHQQLYSIRRVDDYFFKQIAFGPSADAVRESA